MWGLTTRRWWLFVLGVLVLAFGSFDYNYNGVILMLIFYFCRNKPALLAGLYTMFWIPALWGGSLEDPLAWWWAATPSTGRSSACWPCR